MYRATQPVSIIDCVCLGLFDVNVRVVEIVLIAKQLCHVVMNPKLSIAPAERGRGCEGYLEVVNGLLFLSLGTVYNAKHAVGLADPVFLTFLREDFDRTRCSFFCRVELFVPMQQPSKPNQTISLTPHVPREVDPAEPDPGLCRA